MLLRAVRAAVRAPAVHFLVLGTLLAALEARTTGPAGAAARPPIVITAARVAEIRDEYERTLDVVPTPAELDALLAREAEEEMLYREALSLGLDHGDPAVMWRVIEKMHFLYGDAAGQNSEAFRRGLQLGLERDDVVVRSTLITKMRLLAKAASRSGEPTGPELDRELEAYLRLHPDAYRQTDHLSLTQVYLSAGRRGATLEADARALLRQLQASDTQPAAAMHLGDAFASGSTFRSTSPSGLIKIFGEEFAARVSELEPGRWSDPIRSPYGLHLVWVTGRDAASLPALEAVRPRVLRAYRAERRAHYLTRMVDDLRASYEVRVEHDPPTS